MSSLGVNGVIEWIVIILVLFGTSMSLLSSFGLIRLPDVYNRAHATTKSATLGILSILSAAFIYFFFTHGVSSIRLLLAIVFVFLTAPVAGHLVTRSAHRYGTPLAPISVQDDLQDVYDQQAIDDEKVRPVDADN